MFMCMQLLTAIPRSPWTPWGPCGPAGPCAQIIKGNHNNVHVHVNDNQCEINSSYKSKKAFNTFLTNKRIYVA